MNYKILFFILFAILFYSCSDRIDNSAGEGTALSMSIVKTGDFSFDDMKSFKVVVFNDANKKIAGSECKSFSDSERKIRFKIAKSGVYTFEFSGYSNSNCEEPRTWFGKSKRDININNRNTIFIPVAELGDFILLNSRLINKLAFSQAILKDNKIYLVGGTSRMTKELKRKKDEVVCSNLSTDSNIEKCNNIDSNWVCNTYDDNITTCHEVITLEECRAQGADDSTCNYCLNLVENKFTAQYAECLLEKCPINASGGEETKCILNGINNIQLIDLNYFEPKLLSKDENALNLISGRIMHRVVSWGDNILVVGGAGKATLTNKPPFLEPMWTDTRSMMEIYDGKDIVGMDISGYDEKNDFWVGFNTLKTNDALYVFNGKVKSFWDSDSLFYDVVKCSENNNLLSCTLENDFNFYPFVGAGLAKNENGKAFAAGGIYGNDRKNLLKLSYSDFLDAVVSEEIQGLDSLYGAYVFYENDTLYLIGGVKFEKHGNDVVFKEINNKLISYRDESVSADSLVYSSDDNPFEDTVFTVITPYSFELSKGAGEERGLLLTGGLKFDGNMWAPTDAVRFLAFSDMKLHTLGTNSTPTHLKKARFGHSVIVDGDNRVWIIGGIVEDEAGNLIIDNTIELFSPKESNPETK